MQLCCGDLGLGEADAQDRLAANARFQEDTLKLTAAAAAQQGRSDFVQALLLPIAQLEAAAGGQPNWSAAYESFDTRTKSSTKIGVVGWLLIAGAGLVTARKLKWI